jgi:hypothetical protein
VSLSREVEGIERGVRGVEREAGRVGLGVEMERERRRRKNFFRTKKMSQTSEEEEEEKNSSSLLRSLHLSSSLSLLLFPLLFEPLISICSTVVVNFF